MEKSIYEQLNEIDDNVSLGEAVTLDDVSRGKSPLDQASEYILTEEELKSLNGLSIDEMINRLNELKEEKFKEIHPNPPTNIRQKFRAMGFNV